MEQQLTEKILGAVENGNKRALNLLLGCHHTEHVGMLHSSSDYSCTLFNAWRSHLSSEQRLLGPVGSLSRFRGFQALLMIHSCYVTPWMSIVEMAKVCLQLSNDELYHCVSNVAVFLREASKSTPLQPSGCEKWINLASKEILDKLFCESHLCPRYRQMLLYDLLQSLFLFSKDHLSFDANKSLLNTVILRNLSANNISKWVQLLQRFRSLVTIDEMNMAKDRTVEYLREHGSDVSLDGCLILLDLSMEIAKCKVSATDMRSFHSLSSWNQIPLCILVAAQNRLEDYVKLEGLLSSRLMTLSTAELSKFADFAEGMKDCPDWIHTSVLLILCRCTQHLSARLVPKIFSHRDSPLALDSRRISCRVHLLEKLFPEKDIYQEMSLGGTCEIDELLIMEILGDLTYAGAGRFLYPDGTKVVSLSRAGKLLLTLVQANSRSEHQRGVESSCALCRATDVIKLADAMIDDGAIQQNVRVMLFFATSFTVLYNHLQFCRHTVSELIRKGLIRKDLNPRRRNLCVVTTSLMIGSMSCTAIDTDLREGYLDPFLKLLRQPLEGETFMHLAACMTSHPSARKALLQTSETLFARAYPRAWEECTSENTVDDGIIRASLFGFLEILRTSSWKEDEIKAWSILSSCIVMDTPHLKLSDRRWIYQHIEGMMKDSDLDNTASKHLLHATIARLARFALKEAEGSPVRFVPENAFIVWEDPSTCLTQTKQTEDIVALLRLSISLLFHGSLHEIGSSCLDLQSQGHETLLRHVLAYKAQGGKDHRLGLSTMLKFWSEGGVIEGFSIPFNTLVTYLVSVIDYLTQVDTSYSNRGTNTLQLQDFEILEKAFTSILDEERNSIDVAQGDVLPVWLTVETRHLMSSREVDVDPSSIALVLSSLCQLLAEVLCSGLFRTMRDHSQPLSLCRNMVLAVGFMLELSQNLALPFLEQHSMEVETTFKASTVTNMGIEFLPAASRVVQDIIAENLPLQESEEFLTSIVLFCNAIEVSPDVIEVDDWNKLLESLWALYQVVGSEKGATRFITYLESNVIADAAKMKADNGVCSLKSIRSSADVDDRVRSIRLSVLRALEKFLQLASYTVSSNDQTNDGGSVASNDPNKQGNADTLLIAGILRAIAQDLSVGLEGKSGGITGQMYESYLASIQLCGGLIHQLMTQIDGDASHGIMTVVLEVIDVFRGILRSFALEDAILFRSSLIVAVAEFPSLLRHLLRNYAMTNAMDATKLNQFMTSENDITTCLFDDCIFILSRWSTLRDPNSVPWEDIAGRLHTEDLKRRSAGIGQNPVGDLQRITMDYADGDCNREITNDHVEVALRTKELWSWSLSCTFVGLEENWLDSYQVVLPNSMHVTKAIDDAACDRMQLFSTYRQKDLHLSLRKAAKLFSSSTVTVESRAQPAALDMLAMNLPSAPRLRFCHLVATITRVLIHSIRSICTFLASDVPSTSSNMTKACFFEALGTAGAWLLFDDQKADFTVGTFRWLSILRRKRPPGEHPSKRIDTTELVPWVAKASLLIRDLHAGLRSLERALSRTSHADAIDVICGRFFSGGLADILRLTTQKLRLLELTMPSEYSAPSLPDFPSLNQVKRVKKKRMRRHWSHMRLKKRGTTQVARSRNRIVNTFMSLDMKTGEKGDVFSDAFVDLEDFLVEG